MDKTFADKNTRTNVPKETIMRRFNRSWNNFQEIYKSLADSWIVFDTSRKDPIPIEK